jgi:hypothetical protein
VPHCLRCASSPESTHLLPIDCRGHSLGKGRGRKPTQALAHFLSTILYPPLLSHKTRDLEGKGRHICHFPLSACMRKTRGASRGGALASPRPIAIGQSALRTTWAPVHPVMWPTFCAPASLQSGAASPDLLLLGALFLCGRLSGSPSTDSLFTFSRSAPTPSTSRTQAALRSTIAHILASLCEFLIWTLSSATANVFLSLATAAVSQPRPQRPAHS